MQTPFVINDLWPMAVYFLFVIIVIVGMLVISYVLGEHHRGHATNEPYESGSMLIQPSARIRLSAKFYLVAVFFVIFDLESVFIITWAVAIRQLGWAGYAEVLIFIGVLVAALIYLWRLGALDWGPKSSYRRKMPPE